MDRLSIRPNISLLRFRFLGASRSLLSRQRQEDPAPISTPTLGGLRSLTEPRQKLSLDPNGRLKLFSLCSQHTLAWRGPLQLEQSSSTISTCLVFGQIFFNCKRFLWVLGFISPKPRHVAGVLLLPLGQSCLQGSQLLWVALGEGQKFVQCILPWTSCSWGQG